MRGDCAVERENCGFVEEKAPSSMFYLLEFRGVVLLSLSDAFVFPTDAFVFPIAFASVSVLSLPFLHVSMIFFDRDSRFAQGVDIRRFVMNQGLYHRVVGEAFV